MDELDGREMGKKNGESVTTVQAKDFFFLVLHIYVAGIKSVTASMLHCMHFHARICVMS